MYLHYGYVPAPHSIFAGARKLAPAHYLLCEHGRTIVRRYWDPLPCAEEPVERSVEDAEHDADIAAHDSGGRTAGG